MDVFLFLLSLIMDIMLGKYLCIYLFFLAAMVHRMTFGDLNILQCMAFLISFK